MIIVPGFATPPYQFITSTDSSSDCQLTSSGLACTIDVINTVPFGLLFDASYELTLWSYSYSVHDVLNGSLLQSGTGSYTDSAVYITRPVLFSDS